MFRISFCDKPISKVALNCNMKFFLLLAWKLLWSDFILNLFEQRISNAENLLEFSRSKYEFRIFKIQGKLQTCKIINFHYLKLIFLNFWLARSFKVFLTVFWYRKSSTFNMILKTCVSCIKRSHNHISIVSKYKWRMNWVGINIAIYTWTDS